jgi:hypothetical protein
MTQALVRRALESALDTWATAQSLSVAWENVEFTPTAGTAYARSYLLPADTESLFLDRTDRAYTGVYQITLCMPEGTGPAAADALVASLDAAFSPATPLTAGGVTVTLRQPISRGPQLPGEPGMYAVPVSCYYAAHVTS